MLEMMLTIKSVRYDELSFVPWVGSHMESIVYDGVMYTAGGLSTTVASMDNFARYNFQTDTWTSLSPMPSPARSGAMFAKGNYVYFIGGLYQSPGQTSRQLKSVFIYNIATNKWTTASYTLPVTLTEMAYCQVDESKGLIFGGQTGSTVSTAGYTVNIGDGVISFTEDITTGGNSIRRVKPIKVDGSLYFCGGTIGSTSTPNNNFVRYDLATKAWTKLAALPVVCNSLTLVDYQGKIYAYTTHTPTGGYTNVTYIYDISTDTWSDAIPGFGRPKGLTLGVTYNNVGYSPGGYNGTSRVRRFRFNDPSKS